MRDAGHRTPDARRWMPDGRKSKNNISTPRGVDIIILASYIALFLLLDNNQRALHSITPAKIASLGNLTNTAMQGVEASIPYSWVPIFSPGWREAQSRLTSCPRMLSHMKQLVSVGIEPQPLDYESNTLPTEHHESLNIF